MTGCRQRADEMVRRLGALDDGVGQIDRAGGQQLVVDQQPDGRCQRKIA
jgi:hypothetical protein